MSNKLLLPIVFLALICLIFVGATAFAAEDAKPASSEPAATAATAPTSAPPLRHAAPAKSPAPGWPGLLRLRWSLLIEELLRAATPPPVPEVNGTHGLSDDPDPVGTTEEDDDGEDRDGSKQGWKSKAAPPTSDPFDAELPDTHIHFPLP